MSIQWPDLSQYGLEVYVTVPNNSEQKNMAVVVAQEGFDLSEAISQKLSESGFIKGELQGRVAFGKYELHTRDLKYVLGAKEIEVATFEIDDVFLESQFFSFPEVRIEDITSVDDEASSEIVDIAEMTEVESLTESEEVDISLLYEEIEDIKPETEIIPEDQPEVQKAIAPVSDEVISFEEFLLDNGVPSDARTDMARFAREVSNVFSEEQLNQFVREQIAPKDFRRQYLEAAKDMGIVKNLMDKSREIECAYPFLAEYKRRKNLNALPSETNMDSDKLEEFLEWMNNSMRPWHNVTDFQNIYKRNLRITGVNFVVQLMTATEAEAKNLDKVMSGKADDVDLRFSLLVGRLKDHYKMPMARVRKSNLQEMGLDGLIDDIRTRFANLREENLVSEMKV